MVKYPCRRCVSYKDCGDPYREEPCDKRLLAGKTKFTIHTKYEDKPCLSWCPVTAFTGIGIYDISYGQNTCVLAADIVEGIPTKFRHYAIRVDEDGRSYFTRNRQRWYLDDFVKGGYPNV